MTNIMSRCSSYWSKTSAHNVTARRIFAFQKIFLQKNALLQSQLLLLVKKNSNLFVKMVSKTFLIVFGGVTLLGLCACCLLFWKLRKLRKRPFNGSPRSNATLGPAISYQPPAVSANPGRFGQNFGNPVMEPYPQPPFNPYSEPPPPYEAVVNNKFDPSQRHPESELWFLSKQFGLWIFRMLL